MQETGDDDDVDWECVSVKVNSIMQPRVKDDVTRDKSMMLMLLDLDGSLGGKDFGTDTVMGEDVDKRACDASEARELMESEG